jgi:hypothetical protein
MSYEQSVDVVMGRVERDHNCPTARSFVCFLS